MRRGEQPHAQSRRAINTLEQRARRAFAIRAGDVDETELALWITGQFHESERILQPKLRAEPAQAVEELDGISVGHWGAHLSANSGLEIMLSGTNQFDPF